MRVIKKSTGQSKKSQNVIFHLVGEKSPRNRFAQKFEW